VIPLSGVFQVSVSRGLRESLHAPVLLQFPKQIYYIVFLECTFASISETFENLYLFYVVIFASIVLGSQLSSDTIIFLELFHEQLSYEGNMSSFLTFTCLT
jgi:hypothetical protein